MLNYDIVLPLFLIFVKGICLFFYEFFVKGHTRVPNVLKVSSTHRGYSPIEALQSSEFGKTAEAVIGKKNILVI